MNRRGAFCTAFAGCVGLVLVGALRAVWAQGTPPPAQPPARLTIGFVEIEGDARHEPIRAFERVVLKTRDHPFAGEIGRAHV